MKHHTIVAMLVSALARAAAADPVVLPSDDEIARAVAKWQPTIDQAVATAPLPPQVVPEVNVAPFVPPDRLAAPVVVNGSPKLPEVRNGEAIRLQSRASLAPEIPAAGYGSLPPHLLPKAGESQGPLNLDALIKQFDSVVKLPENVPEQFYVFVTFGMPEVKLKRILKLAAEAGAVAVFRGGLDEDDIMMTRISRKLLKLRADPTPRVQIHPPLFARYKVEAVPAWVLALPESAQEDTSGCAPAGTYAMVQGDVNPELALRVIGRKAGDERLRQTARVRLKRLTGS